MGKKLLKYILKHLNQAKYNMTQLKLLFENDIP